MPHFEKLSFCSGGNHKAPTPQNGQTNSHNSFDHFVGLVLKGLNRLPVTEAYLVSCQVSLKILEIKFCLKKSYKDYKESAHFTIFTGEILNNRKHFLV